MSKQHTPGPWKLNSKGWDGQFIYGTDERVPDGRRFIAEVDLNYDGSEANARLIAAAPDLLDAAKLVLAWYEAENDFTKEPDLYKRVEMCRLSEVALRAAIAKATGEKND